MGDELSIQLTEQLRAALETAKQIGDKNVMYLVRRALNACIRRWGEPDTNGID